ncbi:hypothetical protein HQ571_01730 [Candidatus Kuenenbacteria bacterium]|nr:hypothetical protein [Candidatus Kuenenbacteria bacterium]
MSRFAKIFVLSVVCLILMQMASLSFFVLAPTAMAKEFTITNQKTGKEFTLESLRITIPFGDMEPESILTDQDFITCTKGGGGITYNDDGTTSTDPSEGERFCLQIPWFANYISALYRYGVLLGSIIAVITLMMGGVMYMLGGMNQTMINKAKGFMLGSVSGIILLLGSYLLLNSINPNLIYLQPIEVEVAKEAALTDVTFCTELDKTKFTFTDKPCGEEVDYKSSDPSINDSGQCKGSICTGTKKCLQDYASKKYECKDVLVWGEITFPSTAEALQCDNLTATAKKVLLDEGFHIKEIKLCTTINFSDNEGFRFCSKAVPIGKDIKYYYIQASDILGYDLDAYEAEHGAIVSDIVHLRVTINNSNWLFANDMDRTFNAIPPSTLTAPIELRPALACKKEGYAGVLLFSYTLQGGGVLWENPPAISWADFKAGAIPKWDLNVTKYFFTCQGLKTGDMTVEVPILPVWFSLGNFCSHATAAAPGIQQLGESCSNNTDCVAPQTDEIYSTIKSPLICMKGKCFYGGYGDKCDSPGFIAGYGASCGYGFACRATDDEWSLCVLNNSDTSLGYGIRCDPTQDTCGAGLTCSNDHDVFENDNLAEDPRGNYAGCLKAINNEDIDTYVCGDEYGMCYCTENSDCAAPAAKCYESENFCVSGYPGSPCDGPEDCIDFNTQDQICANHTCAFGGQVNGAWQDFGFWDPDPVSIDYDANYFGYQQPDRPW